MNVFKVDALAPTTSPTTSPTIPLRRFDGPRIASWMTCSLALILVLTYSQGASAQGSDNDKGRQSSSKVTQEGEGAAGDGVDSDAQKVEESYQPKGIEYGSFLLFPQIENDFIYSSNVFASENKPQGDFLDKISPELRVRSRFIRHELNFRGNLEQYIFKRFSDDNRLDATASLDGRYDIQRDWELTGLVNLAARAEDRGSPDAAGGKKPTPTQSESVLFGSKRQMGRYVFQGEVGIDRRTFDNVETSAGTSVNNHDRDRWEYRGKLRGAYELFPGYSAVLVGELNKRNYDSSVDDNGFNRDSDGYRLEGGVAVDISQLIRGDFVVGYYQQDYADARLSSPSGLSMRATFNWTPSRLTVVVPSLERSVIETVSATASSIVKTGGGLIIRQEFARNIIGTVTTNLSYDQYGGSREEAWNFDAKIRGTYAFTPNYYAAAEIGYRGRDSNRNGSSYDQVTSFLRIGARI